MNTTLSFDITFEWYLARLLQPSWKGAAVGVVLGVSATYNAVDCMSFVTYLVLHEHHSFI